MADRRRRRPLSSTDEALYGATAGFAGMLGPIVGGALVTADIAGLGRHSIFLMNLPIGVFAFALGFRSDICTSAGHRNEIDSTSAASLYPR